MHERAIRLSGLTLTLTLLGSACAHETQGDLSVFSEEVMTDGGNSGSGGGGSLAALPTSGSTSVTAGTTSAPTGGTFGTGGATGGVPSFSGTPATGGVAGTPAIGGGGAGGGGAGGKAGSGGGGGAGGTPPVGGGQCQTGKLTATAATASSSEDAGALGAASAIDGVATSRWSSAHSAPQWLALDLGKVSHVSRVVIRWEAAFATDYRVEIADNTNGPWTELFADDAGNGGNDDVDDFDPENGRYVRLYGVERSTAYGFSVFEMELYGDPDATCED